MSRLPPGAQEIAAHLRMGVLSLPGVTESGSYSAERGDYSILFRFGEEGLLEIRSDDVLRVKLDFLELDKEKLLGRKDLLELTFETWGMADVHQSLQEILAKLQPGRGGEVSMELTVRSQDDLRSLLRLAHTKYDMMMAR